MAAVDEGAAGAYPSNWAQVARGNPMARLHSPVRRRPPPPLAAHPVFGAGPVLQHPPRVPRRIVQPGVIAQPPSGTYDMPNPFVPLPSPIGRNPTPMPVRAPIGGGYAPGGVTYQPQPVTYPRPGVARAPVLPPGGGAIYDMPNPVGLAPRRSPVNPLLLRLQKLLGGQVR